MTQAGAGPRAATCCARIGLRREREGCSPWSPAMETRWSSASRDVVDGEVPAMLWRRRDDDDVREVEARTMVTASWLGAARNGVGKPPEGLRTPVRCEGDRVDVRLREKGNGRHQRVRKVKGTRGDQEVVALAHRVVVGVLKTAAASANSGERSRSTRDTKKREKGGRRERSARGRGWSARG